MATATINIRMDERTKRDMEAVCKDLGMSMTTAFTIFAKKMGRERRIPFEVSVDPFYSEENLAHLRRSVDALNAGHGAAHDLIDATYEDE
ncbi:type II toxin-antitoxin system RelB/DinJ family antitoxin [Senegalimassilia faecalis]|uniref:Type II toxin-antitoxin system RelB/DinJ family antitoxin n=1 Tax=Senegalimassilia faecalis TaxID=2509433 RepID=A0A4Q2K078_9ACTN|nr:type II toxin-antitoxin system RelB/DinJ family antitoxin [Senegalimassilia faecalis]RXZ53718.1 type II toxin-antitoxin system RelB/DinJ family antitoxin [Senegalimassilia faecalis]